MTVVELLALASRGNASASGKHDHEPVAYGAMLRIADEYERLADMADRENARNAPVEAVTAWSGSRWLPALARLFNPLI